MNKLIIFKKSKRLKKQNKVSETPGLNVFKNFKIAKRAISLFLILILFLSYSMTSIIPLRYSDIMYTEAATITSLEQQQDNIEKKLAALKKEKEELKNQSKALQGELSWLNDRSNAERKKYEALVEELNSAYTEMQIAFKEAASAQSDVELKQEQYKKRLQVMFEYRNKGTFEMLFDAKDLKSFLANIQFISLIAENDKKVIADLTAAKDDAFLKKKAAQEYSDEMQTFVNKKNKEISDLKKNLNQTKEELNNTKTELQKTEKDEKALLAESNAIAAEIKKLQSSGGYYGGKMVWPTPGYTSISPTNNFGMRLHPIYKYWRMHNGVDIASPFNSKIVACADGKVIIAKTIPGYNPITGNNYGGTNYGNYITIDHGGGVSTIYAHCKLLKVKVGDNVKAGQWIAVTGSTGLSTGAHLHFEVRVNGTPVDPIQEKYLGKKK